MDTLSFLNNLNEQSRKEFIAHKRVLSFDQYLGLLDGEPHRLARNAAQYLMDAIHHFGVEAVERPEKTYDRFSLFDTPFDGGRDRLIGQEEVQTEFYEVLSNLAKEARSNRLILLHGPNGSAKTSFVQCLARAMVHYSHHDEGAVYTFNWVFPRGTVSGKRLGFENEGHEEPLIDSYAFLEEDKIAARLPAEMRDHPLFLIPKDQRKPLFDKLTASNTLPAGFRFSDYLVNGDLTPLSRRIFDTLLASYGGDLKRVLAHIQVERFYFSRRYREGVVTIEPQMHVDAQARQVTMDESYGSLPPVLRHLSLYQMSGDLIDGNRGMVEFSDLLKRPVDAFKYLLGTCENSRITVGGVILYLDVILMGTTNDKYLMAFTKSPDFSSFKGRMELVRVPYIRNYRVEEGIYEQLVTPSVVGKPIAPHALFVGALWAVLTRLRRPEKDAYPSAIRDAVAILTPLQKADLYATGTAPADFPFDVRQELKAHISALIAEYDSRPDYEGAIGASAREIKTALLNAAHDPAYATLHPVRVFEELEELIQNPALYEFLQLPGDSEYNDARKLLEGVKERYFERIEHEFKSAMGLITDEEFERIFLRYATHASAFLKKEQVEDPVTHRFGPADEEFLKDMEKSWNITDEPSRARQEFMGRIASFSLDSPGQAPHYIELFKQRYETMRKAYFADRAKDIDYTLQSVLEVLSEAQNTEEDRSTAEAVIENLQLQFGYQREAVAPTVTFLAEGRKR